MEVDDIFRYAKSVAAAKPCVPTTPAVGLKGKRPFANALGQLAPVVRAFAFLQFRWERFSGARPTAWGPRQEFRLGS